MPTPVRLLKQRTPEPAAEAHAPERLIAAILARSLADDWATAREEWELDSVYFQRDPVGTCLCSHSPIIEHCVLVNRHNGNLVVVGNVCVRQFMGLPSEDIFASLRRVAADETKALNPAAIAHAHGKGWIDNWQAAFYRDTWRKRRLSERQMAKRIEVNRRVLYRATR